MAATSPKTTSSPYDPSDGLHQFADARAVYIVAARNWQLFAYGCLVLAILAVTIALFYVRSPREVPYVVAMNASNEPMSLGIAQMLTQDQRAEVLITQYVLRQFVQNWRMVVQAPDFQTKMIHDYVTPFIQPGSSAASTVSAFYAAANPYQRAKQYYVEVSVDEPVPQTPTTYELHWTETAKTYNAVPIQTTEWRGFATIAYKTPDASSVRLNPAGIAITSLTAEQVTTATASPQP